MREWSGHLNEEWLEAWTNGHLTKEEQMLMLEHTGRCICCAEKLADYLERDTLAVPPAYLKEEIWEKTKRADIQAARTVYQTSRQMRLFLYSLKVGLAVVTSLFLLFSTSRIQGINMELRALSDNHTDIRINEKISEGSSQVNDFLQNISEQLMKNIYMEDDYD
ncbi:MAG: hypothetical protein KH452_00530 [Clostridiales bacterium]|nr:hypothetical protein [Clostridiales bacterium]